MLFYTPFLQVLLPRDFGIKSAFVLHGASALVACFLREALRLSVPFVSLVSGSAPVLLVSAVH